MKKSVKTTCGSQRMKQWFVLTALIIAGLFTAQAQNVIYVKNGVTDGEVITVDGVSGAAYTTCKAAMAASSIGDTVRLLEDITETAVNITENGETFIMCCVVHDRRVIDGQGHTLTGTGSNKPAVIYTHGGTIMNLKIRGDVWRGIFIHGYGAPAKLNADLIIKNCDIDEAVYTVTCDGDVPQGYSLFISNTNINGWASYANVFRSVTITDCAFAEGTTGYRGFRPYNATVIQGTTFSSDYTLYSTINTILLKDCEIGGTRLTSANLNNLLDVPQNNPNSKAVVVDGDFSQNAEGEITGGIYGGSLGVLNDMCAEGYRGVPIPSTDPQQYLVTPVYYIHFNANGGDGTMENYYVPRTENTISVPECAFTHDSPAQVFVGWNTAANGTGTPYTPGDNVTLTNDITFYAQWSDFHYIAYHSNDGNDFTRYQLKPDDHSVALEDGTAFARPGQNVSAWNTQADGNGTTYALGSDFPAGINNSPDLYAVWTASPYPIEEVAENISHVGFVVSGNGDFSVGQLFAIPVVVTEASSAPGVQQAYVVTADYEGDRCEGYAYNEYGFSVDATAPAENMYLTNYDPDVRNFFGYDSITHLTLNIHLTQQTKDTVIFLADYNDPRFGTASGDQEVTYSTAEFGCDSVVTLRIYRLGSIADETRTANPGQYEVEVEMAAIPEIVPADFFTAGGTLTPASTAPYVNNYPTGTTTPVVWIATIADSSASFTNYVIINEPDCESLHPEDGSGNTYDVVRLIHDCWLKTNLRAEQYADHTDIPDVHHYPGADPAIYGYLYTYDAATGHYPLRDPDTLQGACPTGWHIPSYEKVAELMQYYESEDLMSQTNWLNPGTDISGFTMQPGGYFTPVGHVPYQDLLVRAYFWTYTPGGSIYHACEFGTGCGTMELIPASETMGYSVRCLKD